MIFRSVPSLHLKMCYATLLHVWAKKIYQHLLLEPICRVFGKYILLVVFLILLFIDHMPRFCQVLKEIKFQTAKLGKSTRLCLPITPSIFRELKYTWLSGNPSYGDLMLWAATVATFFTFCRSGEITVESEKQYDPKVHLSDSGIAADSSVSPNVISLNIKQSKTN